MGRDRDDEHIIIPIKKSDSKLNYYGIFNAYPKETPQTLLGHSLFAGDLFV